MLLVDYRQGSEELIDPLRARGLEVVETELAFGDLAFEGKGPGGTPVDVGVEFKKLEELVAAIRSGRLTGHQLPGMRSATEDQPPLYDYAWLVIEGVIQADRQGKLTKRVGRAFIRPLAGGMTVNELYKRLLSIQMGWGVSWVFTSDRRETLQFLDALYRFWTDRALDEHASHLDLHKPPTLEAVSPFRQTVSGPLFPGVSLKTSLAVEQAFNGSLRRAVTAPIETWAAIETTDKHGNTKRLGRSRAERIIRSVTNE